MVSVHASSPPSKKFILTPMTIFVALEVHGHEKIVYVGLQRSVECSTHLEVTKMEWLLMGVAEPVGKRGDEGQNLTLVLNPTDTELDGANYTCRVTTKAGNVFQRSVSLVVKGDHLFNSILWDHSILHRHFVWQGLIMHEKDEGELYVSLTLRL